MGERRSRSAKPVPMPSSGKTISDRMVGRVIGQMAPLAPRLEVGAVAGFADVFRRVVKMANRENDGRAGVGVRMAVDSPTVRISR